MRIIIAGGRDFKDLDYLTDKVALTVSNLDQDDIQIISGAARGADRMGELFAIDHKYPIRQFRANWELHGKSAGYKRNVQMAEYADALIAFWDGQSKGTGHMIDIARSKGLKVRVYSYPVESTPF